MELHIGSIIKKVAKEKRIGPTELGSKINTSKQNVYGIYKRKSCDAKLLFNIALALEHDFFIEYVKALGLTTLNQGSENRGFQSEEVAFLKEKIRLMENKFDLQKQLMDFMHEKNAKLEIEKKMLENRLLEFEI